MNIICKNCHQSFKGHYCNNCGQTAETHKLNFHYIWHDIQHGLLHFDKGIAYTAKQLFTRPGHSIRDFIEGKRVKHFKPISLVMILATAYVALIHILNIEMFVKAKEAVSTNSHINIEKLSEWLLSHYAIITLAVIPLHTIGTVICFKNKGIISLNILYLTPTKLHKNSMFPFFLFLYFIITAGRQQ